MVRPRTLHGAKQASYLIEVAINSNYSTLGTRMFTASNIAFAPPVIPIHLPAASRLNANESIQARVAELQQQTAASSRITIESICAELAEATAVAKSKGQAQAMVSASALRAKLAGLMVDNVEVGNPGDFDSLNSTREIADKVLERLIEHFIPIDEADRQGLVDLYERHLKETEEYLASIRARPIIAERVDSRNLKTPWRDHRPFTPASPLRIGYKGNGTKPA